MFSLRIDFETKFDKRRSNVQIYTIPPVLRAAVQLHNSGLFSQPRSAEERYYKQCLEKLRSCDRVTLNRQNYREILRLGLSIEEIESMDEFEASSRDVEITLAGSDSKYNEYRIRYMQNLKNSPVQPQDIVEIHMINSPAFYRMKVLSVLRDHLLVRIHLNHEFNSIYRPGLQAVIKFVLNTYSYDCGFYALQQTSDATLRNKVFPTKVVSKKPEEKTGLALNELKFNNPNIESNLEQKTAVINIVNKTSHPAPFILFGPPGTGKTTTLVESILQILSKDLHSKILICAPSNSAVETISKKLLDEPSCGEKYLVRLLSESAKNKMSEESSNSITSSKQNLGGCFEKDEIKSLISDKRVIVCTLNYCARLVYHGFKNFSYVFIDEAGQATETDSLIPFSINDDAHIILAGDHLQLGPVVKSKLAESILGTSMMERLMTSEVYQKSSVSRKYNSSYVVQLLNNYRSHPGIIGIADRLFYDNELKCMGPEDTVLESVQFFNCAGKEEKAANSYSPYNEVEIVEVMVAVREILGKPLKPNGAPVTEQDIGVITPFKAQQDKIVKFLKDANMGGVEVGTVESFQGREKNIIIISTVRSKVFSLNNQSHLGSLSHAKRLNVAITRAKRLLIIIGDGDVLKRDFNWHFVLKTCQLRGTILGKKFVDEDQPQYCGSGNDKQVMDSTTLLSHEREYVVDDLVDSLGYLNINKQEGQFSEPPFLESIYAPICTIPQNEVEVNSLCNNNRVMYLYDYETISLLYNNQASMYVQEVGHCYDNTEPCCPCVSVQPTYFDNQWYNYCTSFTKN